LRSARAPLRRAGRRGEGRCAGRGRGRLEVGALVADPLEERRREVLEQMEAIRHLLGRGGSLTGAEGVAAATIPANDLGPRVLLQPASTSRVP
jgi:hypothetical protein